MNQVKVYYTCSNNNNNKVSLDIHSKITGSLKSVSAIVFNKKPSKDSIRTTDLFIADITPTVTQDQRIVYNEDVMLELGCAISYLPCENIILFNTNKDHVANLKLINSTEYIEYMYTTEEELADYLLVKAKKIYDRLDWKTISYEHTELLHELIQDLTGVNIKSLITKVSRSEKKIIIEIVQKNDYNQYYYIDVVSRKFKNDADLETDLSCTKDINDELKHIHIILSRFIE